MKTIIKITAAILTIMIMAACSGDDNKKTEEPFLERLEYEYVIERLIPYETDPLIVNIEVEEDLLVSDPSKVHIEFSLEHQFASELSYGYQMPNNGNDFKTIVSKLGAFNGYKAQNVLSFNPNNTEMITTDFYNFYDDGNVPSGDYKEGAIDSNLQPETPLFHSMQNKNIKGTWKFLVLDHYIDTYGKLIKIKLIFEEGALEVKQ